MIKKFLTFAMLTLTLVSCSTINQTVSNNTGENAAIETYDLKEGMNMPNVIVETNKGETFDLSKTDKPAIVNFWATWCPPCNQEMPGLQSLYETYGDKIDFIMIDIGESKNEVNKFIEEKKFTFPIGFDESSELATKFNVMAIPTTYIVGKDKIIKNYILGANEEHQFKSYIEAVINE